MSKKETVKKPKLSTQMVYNELSERTHLPLATVERVIKAYGEMVEESISNKVEIPFAHIGVFTFTITFPREFVEWNGFYKGEPVLYYREHNDGYVNIGWRFSRTFQKKMKENTKIPYGSLPALPGVEERRPKSEKRIDFNAILKENLLNKLNEDEDEDNIDIQKEIENNEDEKQ